MVIPDPALGFSPLRSFPLAHPDPLSPPLFSPDPLQWLSLRGATYRYVNVWGVNVRGANCG